MSERLFSGQELKDLGKSKLERLKDAIDSGDKEKAKQLAEDLYKGFTFLHDGYMCWISGLLTFIYNHYGIDAVAEAEQEAHTKEGKVAFPPLDKEFTFRETVLHTVNALHGHVHQPMTVEEDDEKITITVNPCGSGGRLIQKRAYEPGLFATVNEKVPCTWSKGNMPIYCIHCPSMEALEINNTGNFRFVHPPVNEDGSVGPKCKYLLYKNPADIPEEYYTRIGMKKPK
jgi:hypothetical protein